MRASSGNGWLVKIAQVVSSYYPWIGGVETHVRCLAQGCAEAGDNVTVLTHLGDGSPANEWIGQVRVLRFPLTVSSHNYPFSVSMFRYLRQHAAEFDLLHAHNYHTVVGHAAVGGSCPFVFTPHYNATGHTPFRTLMHRMYRSVGARQFAGADAVICVSDAERLLVMRDFPGAATKVVTIPNGIEPRTCDMGEGSVAAYGTVLGKPMVLTVGRLERYKNVNLVIDAFRALQSEAVLIVAGDGPERARLERHARATEPGWPICFTGRIPDSVLNRFFAQATVLTSASAHEAFGLTLAEGLASGTRVVASAIPAHADLARRAGVGARFALVDPRDTKKFAEQLAASLRAGRVLDGDLKLPSWADVVANTRELYSRVRARNHLGCQGSAA